MDGETMSEEIKKIIRKFDDDVEKARRESRGQEKVLINMYIGGK